jgi:multidrug efflux pump
MLVFLTGPIGHSRCGRCFAAAERPFGFVALLGVIALMGMIQRNSVILIDQIEQDRARRAGLGCDCGVGSAARCGLLC